MNLKKVRKSMGCLFITGAMLLTGPQAAFAAERKADVRESRGYDRQNPESHAEQDAEKNTEKITEKNTEKATENDTEKITEKDTEKTTEAQTESQSETETQMREPSTESESQAETKAAFPFLSESQLPGESESNLSDAEGKTEPQTDTGESEPGKKGNKDQEPQVVDRNDPKDGFVVLKKPDKKEHQEDHSDANANLTTNIIAGNGIYLNKLSGTYALTFEDGFKEVMEEIEEDFRQWLEKPEEFTATNWQDVLAVYVLRTYEETGRCQLTLGRESKEELENIFFLMNIRSDSILVKKLSKEVELDAEICSLTVDDYAELKNLEADEKEVLEKYTDAECRKLCAIVTAAKGFVRGEVGEDVSEERVSIVAAACSLVGKVGYFWGGKSYAIGWDSLWGKPMTVTAGGSKSTGKTRGYGLDCSGFVCWSFYNGLNGTDGGIGNHTTSQWNASEMIEGKDAKPGDLVFYDSPIAGDQNHVGLVIGKNEDGSLLVAHCSSSRNGVVVGEAWSSGFKYVRRVLSLK